MEGISTVSFIRVIIEHDDLSYNLLLRVMPSGCLCCKSNSSLVLGSMRDAGKKVCYVSC